MPTDPDPGQSALARAVEDARVLARIERPTIRSVHDVLEDRGRIVTVHGWVLATDLATLVTSYGQLEPERALRIIEQVGDALDAAHAVGVVNRALTPGCVLVADDDRVSVMGFGGGPSPSDVLERASRPDVVELAVLLYLALSGTSPFASREPASIGTGVVPAEHVPLRTHRPELPAALDRVFDRAFAPPPGRNHGAAGELVAAARDALRDRDQEAPGATRPGLAVVDENVQFTVYRPRTIRPTLWYPLVAFAHLSERRPDAPDDPDPIQEVDRQARQTLGEQFTSYAQLTEDFLSSIPREGELTLIPTATGITFNPRSRSFIWTESVHREEFRLQADLGTAGTTVRGRLSVFSGVLLVADVGLSFRVVADAIPDAPIDQGVDHLRHYRKIFASYSHKDVEIAQLFERYASLFGDRYLRDWVDLRAGQVWREELRRMIRDADVFQLLWSSNAMRSDYVREEYEYALSLGRPEFVRPTYWEHPLPQDAAAGLPPEELRALHFQQFAVSSLRGTTEKAGAAEVAPAAAAAAAATPPAPSPRMPRPATPSRPDVVGVAKPGDRICSNCGQPNDPTRKFCRRCGNELRPTSPQPVPAAAPASRPMRLIPMLLLIGLLLLGILGAVAFFSQPPS
jgi:hypothetical protein